MGCRESGVIGSGMHPWSAGCSTRVGLSSTSTAATRTDRRPDRTCPLLRGNDSTSSGRPTSAMIAGPVLPCGTAHSTTRVPCFATQGSSGLRSSSSPTDEYWSVRPTTWWPRPSRCRPPHRICSGHGWGRFEDDLRRLLEGASPGGRFAVHLPDNELKIWRHRGRERGRPESAGARPHRRQRHPSGTRSTRRRF